MKKILALLISVGSVSAFAMDNPLYVGAGAGAAWNNNSSPAAAFRLNGGYMWTPNWAFEVGTTGIAQSGGYPNQSVQYFDASIKGTVRICDIVGLFLQLGGAYGTPGASDFSTGPGYSAATEGTQQGGWNFLTGVGVDVYLTKQVSVNLSDLYYYGANNPEGYTNALLGGVRFAF